MKTVWSERIKELGMTYAEIADAVGAPASTIGDLASGRSKSPRGDLAIRLHGLHVAHCSAGEAPAKPAEQGAKPSKQEAA
jgi:Helix-turn-helix.